MKIIINGIEPQYKIYKMTENVENKFYIGKTRNPLNERMNGHRHGDHGETSADTHFSNVGWNNVTVEIIDAANDEEELSIKEQEHILKNRCSLLLNKKLVNKMNVDVPLKSTNLHVARFWYVDENKYILKYI